jgi:stalled ribosome rescue protein Dom34
MLLRWQKAVDLQAIEVLLISDELFRFVLTCKITKNIIKELSILKFTSE